MNAAISKVAKLLPRKVLSLLLLTIVILLSIITLANENIIQTFALVKPPPPPATVTPTSNTPVPVFTILPTVGPSGPATPAPPGAGTVTPTTPATTVTPTPELVIKPDPRCIVGSGNGLGNGGNGLAATPTNTPNNSMPQRPVPDATKTDPYYYNLPDDYNMNSCAKLASGDGSDIIRTQIELGRCENGKSSRNNTLDCKEDWLAAYSEVLTVDEFPLLNWLSAVEPTKDNNVSTICKKDIDTNITDNTGFRTALKFSNEYSGLLYFVDTQNNRQKVNYAFPRLGTATACGVYENEDVTKPLKLDINSFSDNFAKVASPITDSYAGTLKEDHSNASPEGVLAIMSRWLRDINDFFFSASLKSKEAEQLKTVATVSDNPSLTSVCTDLTRPITKVNVSDPVKYGEPVVVNQQKELIDLTNDQVCDSQFTDGKITGATCTMPRGESFFGGYCTPLSSGNFPQSNNGGACTVTICGQEFSCNANMGQAYSQCRSQQGSVGNVRGRIMYHFQVTGYDKLSIPGANMMLNNEVEMTEKVNSAYDVQHGENIGMVITGVHAVLDLGSPTNEPYNIYGMDNPDLRPGDINSPLARYISYKKQPANVIFKNVGKFASLGSVDLQYYFPFLGQIPKIRERFAVINSNSKNSETAYTLRKQYENAGRLGEAGSTGAQVAGWTWSTNVDKNVLDPQLKFCEDLTEAEQLIQDCYCTKGSTAKKCNDPIHNYLCQSGLGLNCEEPVQCITPETPYIPPSGTPTPTPTPDDNFFEIQAAPFSCAPIATALDAKIFIDKMVAKYPGKIKNINFQFAGALGYCSAASSTILTCPSVFSAWMQNKLLLHELMHTARGAGESGEVELAASLLEDYIISGSCKGGEYDFIGKDNKKRTPGEILAALQKLQITDQELWDFAVNKKDTISQYVSNIVENGQKFSDLYCKGFGFNNNRSVSSIPCTSGPSTPAPTKAPIGPTPNSCPVGFNTSSCKLDSIAGKVAYPVDSSISISNSNKTHPGVDFGAPSGTQVYASASGEVVFARDGLGVKEFATDVPGPLNGVVTSDGIFYNGYGNMIAIKSKEGTIIYAHLLKGSVAVKKGDCVAMNAPIAKTGASGNVLGNPGDHLHFEMRNTTAATCKNGGQSYDGSPQCVFNNGNTIANLDKNLSSPRVNNSNTIPNSCTGNSGGSNGNGSGNSGSNNGIDTIGYCSDTTPIDSGTDDNLNSGDQINDGSGNGDGSSFANSEAGLLCMMKKAADTVNADGPKIAPEVIYAFTMKENGGLFCTKYWNDWLIPGNKNLTKSPCDKGANSLSLISKNNAWINSATNDVRGITQFSAGTFISQVNRHKDEMRKCIAALGVHNPPVGDEIDNLTTSKTGGEFTRHTIGNSFCITAIWSAYLAKGHEGKFITPDQWNDVNGYGAQVLTKVGYNYYGNCSDNYCVNLVKHAKNAVTKKLFTNLKCDSNNTL